MRAPFAVLVALVALVVPATAAALVAPQRALVSEIEGEVMCPICGELLELAESPQAEREKAFVERLVVAGKTRAEVKEALVAQYGEAVLAQPHSSGFNLSVYLVPIIAFLVAIVALGFGVLRWRRASGGGGSGGSRPPPEGPSAEDAERLDADLARYDL